MMNSVVHFLFVSTYFILINAHEGHRHRPDTAPVMDFRPAVTLPAPTRRDHGWKISLPLPNNLKTYEDYYDYDDYSSPITVGYREYTEETISFIEGSGDDPTKTPETRLYDMEDSESDELERSKTNAFQPSSFLILILVSGLLFVSRKY